MSILKTQTLPKSVQRLDPENYSIADTELYALIEARDQLAALRAERDALRSKAAIVIAGWEIFGYASNHDLNILKEFLRSSAEGNA